MSHSPSTDTQMDQPIRLQPSTALKIAQRNLRADLMKVLLKFSNLALDSEVSKALLADIIKMYDLHLACYCPGYESGLLRIHLAMGDAGVELRPLNLMTGLWLQGVYGVGSSELHTNTDGSQWYANRIVFFRYDAKDGLRVIPVSRVDLLKEVT